MQLRPPTRHTDGIRCVDIGASPSRARTPLHHAQVHMTMPRRAAVRTTSIAASLAVVLAACGTSDLEFFDVRVTPTEECDILPQGEFCVSAEELSPPTIEVWSVEWRRDGFAEDVRIFVDDEAWIAAFTDAESAPGELRAEQRAVVASAPGPCTTATTRTLELFISDIDITGVLAGKTRLEGPEACGENPRGERTTSRVDGVAVEAP